MVLPINIGHKSLPIIIGPYVISGFVWQHPAPLKGDRWEPIQGFSGTHAVGLLIDRPPSCLMGWIDTFGVTTMHVYLRNAITTCLND